MQNPFINWNNGNNNQNLINQNMNHINPNMIPNMNLNMNQINPNIIPNMNLNMNQINPNMIPNMNLNMNQINPNMIPNMNEANLNMGQFNLDAGQNDNDNSISLNQNSSDDEIEDVLPYIDEPKMLLKFSNISTIKNGTYIKVKLPKSITKSDLYSIAKKYQVDYNSNILLTHNNYLLKEDDTSIEGIEEGSVINIIEDVDFPDGAYYKALMEKNKNYERMSFIFRIEGKINKIQFPKNIKVSEMVKAAFSKLLLNSKSSRINYIDSSDINKKIKDKFNGNESFSISFYDPLENHWRFGKIIYADVLDIRSNGNIQNIVAIGTLNSINRLIYSIEITFYRKLKKIIIGNKEFYKNEIKDFSLKSLGINDSFKCGAEFENEVGI